MWEHYQAPPEFKQVQPGGGDEDFVVAAPPGVEIPYKLEELGCCNNFHFRVREDGVIEMGRHSGDEYVWEPYYDYKAPNRIGWTFIISTHG